MFKKTFLLFFVFYINTSIAQPPYSTIPFADDYKGKADLVIKSAKIKTQTGREVVCIAGDVSDPETLAKIDAELAARGCYLDILVAHAMAPIGLR